MKKYNKRVWLNKSNIPSTGSVVCYYGPSSWDINEVDMFVEVASCHEAARLHKIRMESPHAYLSKVKKLHAELGKYIEFLEANIPVK